MASAPLNPVSQSFPNTIAEKFDDSNYFHWQQHVEPVIKAHKLQCFVVNPVIPPHHLTEDDSIADRVNPEYEAWEVQDQTLLVWLQSTFSKSVLSHVLGSNHSYQVWDKIHEYFCLHTKSHARQLRTAMRAVSLEGKSIKEYLQKIKSYVDELAGVGVLVQHEEYVYALLEGILSDYAPVISVIESKKCTPSIAEIEALLYGHETCLVRYYKEAQMLSSPSLNCTQDYSHSNSYKYGDFGGSRGSFGCDSGRSGPSNHDAKRNGGGSGRGQGNGRFANFQCQICLKYGHTVNVCHFQSDMSFQPHESLTFFDPVTLQAIPYSSGSIRSSNTWVNPNSKLAVSAPN
ncbi:hypothetical protein GYH30_042596 [Glycine max]|nr:hypothetical protein GYH30_042596 [Glycine max]